ncbi:MAG: hypothetical protein IJU23_12635 [Proteobacteria bacterium]|nr:hypothetical protein [Pseudomonadota bacterium]
MENGKKISPQMIESYFDGELSSDEFEALSREDLIHCETYEALLELRNVVRMDSQLALDDVDAGSMLDAINARLDAAACPSVQAKPVEPPKELDMLSQPKRRTSKQFFARWAPALIGAALFLLSIPGLIHWIADGTVAREAQPQPQTVVVIDNNGAKHAPGYQNNLPDSIAVPAVQPSNNQLTVEEMDFAIRHLIRRIETLENNQGDKKNIIEKVPTDDGKQL